LHRDLVVLAGHPDLLAPRAASAAAPEAREQVGEVDVLERVAGIREPAGPSRRRPELLAGTDLSELVVGGTLLRVLERAVGLRDLLELLLGVGLLGDIGMVLAREPAIGLGDL